MWPPRWRGRSPGLRVAAVGAWQIAWSSCARRGVVAGPLVFVWPPWGRGWSPGLVWPPWGRVAEALTNQSHQGMVIANLLEILCPALNFRYRNNCIRVLWIRTEHILRKWPPSTEGVDDQDSVEVGIDF